MTTVHLLRKEYYEKRKTILIYAAAYIVGIIGIRLIFVHPALHEEFYHSVLNFGLYLLGFIFASTCFSEIHQLARKHAWLMLPASAAEKLVVQVIIASLLFPIGLLLLTSGASLIAELISQVAYRESIRIFHPFSSEVGIRVLHFLVLSSLFLLGSAYFRKHQYIKTLLSLFAFGMLIALLGAVLARPFTYSFTEATVQLSIDSGIHSIPQTTASSPSIVFFQAVGKLVQGAYWILLAPFCWLVTYLRLQEVEADDAV